MLEWFAANWYYVLMVLVAISGLAVKIRHDTKRENREERIERQRRAESLLPLKGTYERMWQILDKQSNRCSQYPKSVYGRILNREELVVEFRELLKAIPPQEKGEYDVLFDPGSFRGHEAVQVLEQKKATLQSRMEAIDMEIKGTGDNKGNVM